MTKRPRIPDLDARISDPSRRGVKTIKCHGCRSWVLAGIDADICAFPAIAEWAPLTAMGELAAVLSDRRTYMIEPDSPPRRSLKLTWRSARTIKACPAGSGEQDRRQGDILAEHRCHAPPLPQDRTRLPDPPAERMIDYDAPPPF